MSPTPPNTAGNKIRYLIRARDDAGPLAAFLDKASQDPGIAVVDLIGPAGQPPHTAVVEMSADKALAVAQDLVGGANQLIIEPDRPLSLFDKED